MLKGPDNVAEWPAIELVLARAEAPANKAVCTTPPSVVTELARHEVEDVGSPAKYQTPLRVPAQRGELVAQISFASDALGGHQSDRGARAGNPSPSARKVIARAQ
jgi:hypothetical protein